jgi:hypothetical protein
MFQNFEQNRFGKNTLNASMVQITMTYSGIGDVNSPCIKMTNK